MPYIPFTTEQKELAASIDLEAFLLSRGEKLIQSGREKRLASDHSITIRGNEWYDHAQEQGGNAISFVQRYYNLSFPEAMQREYILISVNKLKPYSVYAHSWLHHHLCHAGVKAE